MSNPAVTTVDYEAVNEFANTFELNLPQFVAAAILLMVRNDADAGDVEDFADNYLTMQEENSDDFPDSLSLADWMFEVKSWAQFEAIKRDRATTRQAQDNSVYVGQDFADEF